MASDPNRSALRQIDRLIQGGSVTGLDEGQLVDRFLADSDVLASGRQWSSDTVRWCWGSVVAGWPILKTLEDTFQATLLILVREGGGRP